MNPPKILKLFQNIHMNLGHDGLIKLSKQNKVDVYKMENGDLLMFINKRGDKLKVLGPFGRVVGYLKMPNGQRIMMEALQYIPHTFGASGFDYDKACVKALEKRIGEYPQARKIS